MIIDVWSDVVCPWCFIGRRRLQRALADLTTRDEIVIRHRAFQLQPEISTVLPTTEYLGSKYGMAQAQVLEMQENVCSIADGEGLCYKLDETLSGNTFDAHRLLAWAEGFGKQDELLEAMYHAYFEAGRPLFTHADLLAITDEVGLDRGTAQELLLSDSFAAQVEEDGNLARALGATGVPFYVFDMKFGISGAQPIEVFVKTLEESLESARKGLA